MSFRFWLLAVDSRDLSQAEEEITACKSELSHKMTTIVTQNVDHNDYDEDVTFSSYCAYGHLLPRRKSKNILALFFSGLFTVQRRFHQYFCFLPK